MNRPSHSISPVDERLVDELDAFADDDARSPAVALVTHQVEEIFPAALRTCC
jgi:hypothetical protein